MAWTYLIIAGLLEIGFASTLKLTEGFTKLWPTLVFLAFVISSGIFLAKSLKDIPIGTAYAVWTGIGAAGTAIFGILVYKEPATAMRIFFIAMLIAAIVGLKFTSTET